MTGLGYQVASVQFSSVQFSHSVVSDSLWPHESQHARPPCPSPSPGVHSDSCPSSQWCHPAISSSVVPFSSCPQSSRIKVFSNESTLRMRWPKDWSFSFSINFPLIPSHIGFPIPEYMTWFYKFPNPKNVVIYFMRKQKRRRNYCMGSWTEGEEWYTHLILSKK